MRRTAWGPIDFRTSSLWYYKVLSLLREAFPFDLRALPVQSVIRKAIVTLLMCLIHFTSYLKRWIRDGRSTKRLHTVRVSRERLPLRALPVAGSAYRGQQRAYLVGITLLACTAKGPSEIDVMWQNSTLFEGHVGPVILKQCGSRFYLFHPR
jgi:hypothetical protein